MDVYEYEAFIRKVRTIIAEMVNESLEPLDDEQRLALLLVSAEQVADLLRTALYKHWDQERSCG